MRAPGLSNGTPRGSKNGRGPGGLCIGFLAVLIFRGPLRAHLLSNYAENRPDLFIAWSNLICLMLIEVVKVPRTDSIK